MGTSFEPSPIAKTVSFGLFKVPLIKWTTLAFYEGLALQIIIASHLEVI
jgi:hypothetical protein